MFVVVSVCYIVYCCGKCAKEYCLPEAESGSKLIKFAVCGSGSGKYIRVNIKLSLISVGYSCCWLVLGVECSVEA